jgi:hypothetical protein
MGFRIGNLGQKRKPNAFSDRPDDDPDGPDPKTFPHYGIGKSPWALVRSAKFIPTLYQKARIWLFQYRF